MSRPLLAFALVATAFLPTALGRQTSPEGKHELAEFGLTIDLAGLQYGPPRSGSFKGDFHVVFDGKRVDFACTRFPQGLSVFLEPEHVAIQARQQLEGIFRVVSRKTHDGDYGAAPYATVVHEHVLDAYSAETPSGDLVTLCGILPEYTGAFVIRARSSEPLDEGTLAAVIDVFTTRVSSSNEPRDPAWTQAQIDARIDREMPDGVDRDDIEVTRSEHYIVIGDGKSPKKVVAVLEETYEDFVGTFGVEPREGRMLLPVLHFEDEDDFVDLLVNKGRSRESALKHNETDGEDLVITTGKVNDDELTTYAASRHLHRNLLFLRGAGSWFDIGVPVHMEAVRHKTVRSDHLDLGRRITRTGELYPFDEFMCLESLARSSTGELLDEAGRNWNWQQAGMMVEFVRMSEATKDLAGRFFLEVGLAPRNDLQEIESTLRSLWDVDVAGFEKMFLEYWEKPQKKL